MTKVFCTPSHKCQPNLLQPSQGQSPLGPARALLSPRSRLDAVPIPQASRFVLCSAVTPSSAWVSKILRTPKLSLIPGLGTPEPTLAFPHLRLRFPTPGKVPRFFQNSPAPAPVAMWDKHCQIPQVLPPQEAVPSSREDSGPQ